MSEPENLVLHMLREMRGEMTEIRGEVVGLRSEVAGIKGEVADLRSEVKSLRADVASDLMSLEKRMNERFEFLNRAVTGYHSTVVGHGILISEFEQRLRRVEDHLKLPPDGKH